MDINGFYAPSNSTWYSSAVAGEQTKVLSTEAGLLFYLRIVNTTSSARYAFVYDNTAASGTLLMPPIPLAANGQVQLPLPGGVPFGTGCTVSTSTTQTSYAAGGANDLQIHALTK